jgi:uncharacterized protein YkwD
MVARWLAALMCLAMLAPAAAAAGEPRPKGKPLVLRASLGKAVLAEINKMRRDPKGYARMLKTEYRSRYDGNLLRLPDRDPIRTREGAKALEEAIAVLERTRPVRALAWSPGLAKAAALHAADIGPRGSLDHRGNDGSWPHQRMGRYGLLTGLGGENLDFGFADARGVVVHLVVDDNVADRGHRKNLLNDEYRQIGVACGRHSIYEAVCVMDFAETFREKK